MYLNERFHWQVGAKLLAAAEDGSLERIMREKAWAECGTDMLHHCRKSLRNRFKLVVIVPDLLYQAPESMQTGR